ncbi:MAG TPA: CcmD family protein [Thermoanaerobaculia bacterium]|nr:CcmD family protein [Thermoanaerobaculia bacterium]
MNALGFVAACNAVIWIGLWVYLLRLDARLKASERHERSAG